MQDYCISNSSIFEKLDVQKTATIRGAVEQELLSGDELFKELVMINFVVCNSKNIKRYEEQTLFNDRSDISLKDLWINFSIPR